MTPARHRSRRRRALFVLARVVPCLALLVLAARTAHGQRPLPLDSLVPPSPAPNGFIADGGPVLSDSARAAINGRIAELRRTTGGDVAVAILRDLHDRAPTDVGVAIYRAWRVGRVDSLGSARRDLGALLLIVPKELAPSGRGECWVTTGRGAEGELIDAHAGEICRDSVIPHLRDKDYDGAVAAGVEGIARDFAATTAGLPNAGASVSTVRDVGGEGGGKGGVILGVLGGAGVLGAGVAGGLAWRRRRPRTCPRGHGDMVRLSEAEDDAALSLGQRVEERVGSVDYDVWACRQCDARIVIPYKATWTSYKGCPRCEFRTLKQTTRTIHSATQFSEGLDEITLHCENCGWHDTTTRVTPRLPPPSSSSSGGSGGGGGGSSFGGSGATSGGGGGGSY